MSEQLVQATIVIVIATDSKRGSRGEAEVVELLTVFVSILEEIETRHAVGVYY
jgi:hypothetical protein